MIEENKDYLMEVKRGEEAEQQRTEIRKRIREIRKLVSEVEEEGINNSDLLAEAHERAVDVVEQAEDSLEDADFDELSWIEERVDRALEAFRGVVQER